MEMDRALQRSILEKMAAAYPHALMPNDLNEFIEHQSLDKVIGTLLYLQEHDLVQVSVSQFTDGSWNYKGSQPIITAKGLDFLADDGGLTTILGTLTIKFHEDTLRQLIEAKIIGSDLTDKEKSATLKAIKELPAEGIKQVSTKLIELGMENAPRALGVIQSLFQ
jgi:hypothetical protein